jgi:hypothetical protein
MFIKRNKAVDLVKPFSDTDEEGIKLRTEIVEATLTIEQSESKIENLKTLIKTLEGERSDASRKLDYGSRAIVPCEQFFDFDKNLVRTRRNDTGEYLEDRTIATTERDPELTDEAVEEIPEWVKKEEAPIEAPVDPDAAIGGTDKVSEVDQNYRENEEAAE